MPCFDQTFPCPPPCPPPCNCSTNDIVFNGANNLCTGVTFNSKLTDVLNLIQTFAQNRLYSIIPSPSIAVTAVPGTCNKSAQPTVKISTDSDNALSLHSNGLYVAPGDAITPTPYTSDHGIVLLPTDHNFRLVESLDGAATKFLWNYPKAAFRAGQTTGVQWDNTNIGNYSVAFGLDTYATGIGSFTGGTSSSVISNYSFAYGQGNSIQSTFSTVFGLNITVSPDSTGSFLAGSSVATSQPYSAVFGRSSGASGTTSLGISQGGSFVAGLGNHVNGESNFAIGESITVSGDFSGGFGLANIMTPDYTYTFGRRLTASTITNHVIVGEYNDATDVTNDTVSPSSPNAKPAFTVGNGYVSGTAPFEVENFFNGLIIYKNGTARFYGAIDQRGSTRGILPANWTTGGRPSSPIPGEQGFNTTASKMEYWSGSAWVQW